MPPLANILSFSLKKTIILICMINLSSCAIIEPPTIYDASSHFIAGDYVAARQVYERIIEENNNSFFVEQAHYRFGIAYLTGLGGPQNITQAVYHFEQIPDESGVNVILAGLYLDGKYIEQNTEKAIELYKKSGTRRAKLELAMLYWQGDKVPQNKVYAQQLLNELVTSDNLQYLSNLSHPIRDSGLCVKEFEKASAIDKGGCLNESDEKIWEEAEVLWQKRDTSDVNYATNLLVHLYLATLNKAGDKPLSWELVIVNESYRNKDYAKIQQSYQRIVQEGTDVASVSEAHYMLGIIAFTGLGGMQNIPQAVYHLEQVTGSSEDKASYILAGLYLDGIGVERDTKQAIKLYENANNARAMLDLAILYGFGKGEEIAVDQERSMALIQHLIANEFKDNLMITHPINKRLCDENFDNISAVDKGICLSQDDEGIWKYAQKLWEKRDRSDFDYGARLLTQLYSSTLNKEQDQPLAWFLWAASEGDVFSQVGVGKLYLKGEFVKQDYSQATYWFEKAAKQGDVEAMLYMGWLSINASTEKGYLAALKWYHLAAKKESSTAIIELSNLYLSPPQGQEKDIAKGLQWLQLGTHRGDPIAKHRLADAYFNSEYNMQHKQAVAMQMYEELFNEENDLKAAYHLGNCHLYGTAQLGSDYKKAVKWFTKAAEKEHFPAKLRLAYLLDELRVHSEAAKWRETVIYTDLSTVSEQQVVDIIELQYRQGMYYYDQKTSEESIEKAIRIFSLAAGTGEPRSLAQLGLLYFKGVLVPKDIEKAHDWLSKWEATRKKFNKTDRAKGDKYEQLKYENEEAEKALKELSFLDLASELT